MRQAPLGDSQLAIQEYEPQVLESASLLYRFGPRSQHPIIDTHVCGSPACRGHEEATQVVKFRHKDEFLQRNFTRCNFKARDPRAVWAGRADSRHFNRREGQRASDLQKGCLTNAGLSEDLPDAQTVELSSLGSTSACNRCHVVALTSG